MERVCVRGRGAMHSGVWRSTFGTLLAVVVTAASLFGGAAMPLDVWAQELPSATVKVWDTAVPVGGLSLGLTPGESVEDPMGQTGHGTSFPTIVTVYANGSHPLGPSGVSYWNPDGNLFVWYGKTIGFPGGVDINRSAPVLAATSSVFGSFTFGPGDVWIGGQQNEPLYVQLAGTFTDVLGNEVGRFRTYGTDSALVPSGARAWGVKVDQATGHVFLAQPGEGRITRLDPVTAGTTLWQMGGGPAGITLDAAGRPYTTLSRLDVVLRVDPGPDGVLGTVLLDGTTDDIVTFWRVPNLGGIRSFRDVPPPTLQEEYPNAIITTDANGNVWFTESNSHEIGRLSAGPDGVLGTADDVICEYSKEGLLNPQQIASTGSGNSLQVYFTEGEGNSVSVLTQVEADMAPPPTQICTTVPAEQLQQPNFTVFRAQTVFFDEEVMPLRTPIVPTVHEVPGLDGSASGTTTTADGKLIPPILRFSPMPNPLLSADGTPIGDAGNGFPSGMTGVYATNRVAGAHLKGNKHFEVTSGAVIAQPPPPSEALPGRMTGGGRVFTADGTRVTHGMVLQCVVTADARDRRSVLQVNWGDSHRFHLTRLTGATCSDDPSIDPGPSDDGEPPAPFDTHTGSGTGRYDGVAGATVEWTFTDAGEPGINRDRARMVIKDAAGVVVLEVDAMLDGGNHQAHAEVTK